jgi:GNAT superfamily N-acetyltransferase
MSMQPEVLPSVDQMILVPAPRRVSANAPTPKASSAVEDDLTVLESSAVHRCAQGALFDRCFGRSGGAEAVRWRYDGCPHGGTIAPIAFEDGRLVASYACSPRRVLYRGELLAPAVGQTGDVMTDPELRSRGVFTALHWRAIAAARHAGWPAVWGLPNEYSGRIFFGKLGWLLAGHIGPWNFVLAADKKGRQERLVNGRLAAYGAPWAAWRGASARRRLRVSSLEVQRVTHFPEDVGALGAAIAPRFDWMVQRDKAYLDWRFVDAPSRLFRALVLRDASGALVAYAVVQLPREGSAVGFIADLVGVDKGAEGAALDAALDELAGAGASVARAYAMLDSAWEHLLERGGFRRPRGYKPVGAYPLDCDHALAVATMHTSRWYFTDGDRDDETAR